MPYIKNTKRGKISPARESNTNHIEMNNIDCAGDLNYAFTMILINYIERKGLNYQNINDIVGALEGAKSEFQRRTVIKYEDTKRLNNGDVYPVNMTYETCFNSTRDDNG